jgi:hypothetical protein
MRFADDERECLEPVLVTCQAMGELTWNAVPVLELIKGEEICSRVVWLRRRMRKSFTRQGRAGLDWCHAT